MQSINKSLLIKQFLQKYYILNTKDTRTTKITKIKDHLHLITLTEATTRHIGHIISQTFPQAQKSRINTTINSKTIRTTSYNILFQDPNKQDNIIKK